MNATREPYNAIQPQRGNRAEENAAPRCRALILLSIGVLGCLWAQGFAEAQEHRHGASVRAAIHECSVKAGKYSNTDELITQLSVYRVCMFRHRVSR
jgi:hypothetical protein